MFTKVTNERICQYSLGNEGYGYGKYVMGLYLLEAFVASQLLYNWVMTVTKGIIVILERGSGKKCRGEYWDKISTLKRREVDPITQPRLRDVSHPSSDLKRLMNIISNSNDVRDGIPYRAVEGPTETRKEMKVEVSPYVSFIHSNTNEEKANGNE
ncbi:hypothetical protein L1987_54705 [Smallanthus sonchifolius]|uniref:Uncharacterized protein n=1 Tax=Smallanthus sonchifolius TaxID=185202 RepID=A0ACB9E7C5_9ASTR|nr:hypothetical protein L1987_54705 [Smallanthus sonchifolius]